MNKIAWVCLWATLFACACGDDSLASQDDVNSGQNGDHVNITKGCDGVDGQYTIDNFTIIPQEGGDSPCSDNLV